MKAGGLLEKPGQGRVLVVLLLVGLGGAAQRAQVLEHPLGVLALLGFRRVVAPVLVVGDQPAVEHHRGDDDVPERASGAQLAPDALESFAEPREPLAHGLGADALQSRSRARLRRSGRPDVVAGERDHRLAVAVPTPRLGEPMARRNACASAGLASSVR